MRILSSWPVVARRAVLYGLIGGVIFLGLNLVGWVAFLTYKNQMRITVSEAADPAGLLSEKKAYYLAHRDEYSALFLGDSRTLCGIHPDLIDPVWGRHSYNLSHWATWMPAQYALISDIAPSIPKDTIVVWSIGHQNFAGSPIPPVYPPGWTRIIPMAVMGVDIKELLAAQLAFTPPLALVGRNEQFFEKITQLLGAPLWHNASAAASETKVDAGIARMKDMTADPLTSYLEPWRDDQGRLASIAQFKTNGAMLRTELMSSFYRDKQKADRAAGNAASAVDFVADDTQMKLFRDILDTFKAQGLSVIINELEETPYRYRDPSDRMAFRQWMRTQIKPIVEEYGFKYVHTDEARLTDADYFDFNHLNAVGVRKHNAVLARKLKGVTR